MPDNSQVTTGTSQQSSNELARGWSVILAAMLGVGIGVSSLPYYTFGIFFKELQDTFGWTRTQLSSGQFAYLLCLALASPAVGAAIDRYGVRRPLLISLIWLAVSLATLSTVDTLGAFIAVQAIMAVLASASSPLAYTRIINTWFVTTRGLALGLTLTGTGIAAAVAPLLLSGVITRDGWRAGYVALAVTVACATPLVLCLLRPRPKDRRDADHGVANGMPFDAVLRTRTFWHLFSIFFVLPIAVNGLVAHLVPMLSDAGHSLRDAASIVSIIGVAVIIGRIVIGIAVDRWFAPHVAAAAMGLTGLGIAALMSSGSSAAPAAAFAIGFALGAEADMLSYFNARYFGLRAYGRIYGTQYAGFMIGTGLSPLWMAAIYDRFASYQPALTISLMLISIVAIAFVLLPRFPEVRLELSDCRQPYRPADE